MIAPVPSSSPLSMAPLTLCNRLKNMALAIARVAIQILFVAISVASAAVVFPVSLHVVAIPFVAFGSAFLSGFFFQKESRAAPLQPAQLPPIIYSESQPPITQTTSVPQEAPCGLVNTGNNCAFNALVHYLNSDPVCAAWVRNPATLPAPFAPFATFFAAYDQALQERRPVASANTQSLRLALSHISALVPASTEQVDAPNTLDIILDAMPDQAKVRIAETRAYNLNGRPLIKDSPDDGVVRKEERKGQIPLHIPEDEAHPALERMLQLYCNEVGVLSRKTRSGENQDYPVTTQREFLEAPPALRFQICRYKPVSPGLLSRLISFVRRKKPEIKTIKNETAIRVPEILTINLADGTSRRYQLVSFVLHGGEDNQGHYVAGRILNGAKYLMDDALVTALDPMRWQGLLERAYLVQYVPVPA
jgi:hypothetical protein